MLIRMPYMCMSGTYALYVFFAVPTVSRSRCLVYMPIRMPYMCMLVRTPYICVHAYTYALYVYACTNALYTCLVLTPYTTHITHIRHTYIRLLGVRLIRMSGTYALYVFFVVSTVLRCRCLVYMLIRMPYMCMLVRTPYTHVWYLRLIRNI